MSTDGDDDEPKLSMNVLINKRRSKVLFVETNSDVVDILLSFLTLPWGRIVSNLNLYNGDLWADVGSLTSLYRGLFDLDSSHFCVPGAKEILENPTSLLEHECIIPELNDFLSRPRKVYFCQRLEMS